MFAMAGDDWTVMLKLSLGIGTRGGEFRDVDENGGKDDADGCDCLCGDEDRCPLDIFDGIVNSCFKLSPIIVVRNLPAP